MVMILSYAYKVNFTIIANAFVTYFTTKYLCYAASVIQNANHNFNNFKI